MQTYTFIPESYYGLTLGGLPGHPKTAVALGGRDEVTGEWWQAPIEPDPDNPVYSLLILVPWSVPFTRVLTADEFLEAVADWIEEPVVSS